tara:strand:- start:552 stop:1790 length:1239 start_codon:yes stop_codon:yes gene_type:complete
MKSFLQFLTEATATPSQQAKRLGLKGDGHGGWYDSKGEFAAKTERGKLVFYNKRQKVGQDPPQTDKEKQISAPTKAPGKVATQEPAKVSAPAAVEPEATKDVEGAEKKGSTLTIVFGRFNPPTIGHEQLLNTAASVAEDDNYIIVPSRTQDSKKNPLSPDQKISLMRDMFPDHSERIINDSKIRTIFDVLQKASIDGYKNVVIVGGSDRVQEFDKLANQYNNGDMYQFDSIESRSGGARDPDSDDDVKGMSASKQRKAAAEGNFELFAKGVPKSLSKEKVEDLFDTLRSSMNIKEGFNMWEIAPKFDWKGLRENYVTDQIYNIGDLVENINNGLVGRIIRRGTNYLICVTEENIMFKSWIKDVSEAVVNGTEQQGVPADQRLVGTDSLRKYTETMVPGSQWGRNFINKYRKK